MASQKIVVRYTDGRLLKGHTRNFNPAGSSFVLEPVDAGASAEPVAVNMRDLKAVFFVQDFLGKQGYKDKAFFVSGQPYQGRKIKVQFMDGETMVGSTPNYSADTSGFFIFPTDPQSNTIKVFAIAASVRDVELL